MKLMSSPKLFLQSLLISEIFVSYASKSTNAMIDKGFTNIIENRCYQQFVLVLNDWFI